MVFFQELHSEYCVNVWMLDPGMLGLLLTLGCSIGWLVACTLVVGIALSLDAFARDVGVVFVLVCISYAWGVSLVVFSCFAC